MDYLQFAASMNNMGAFSILTGDIRGAFDFYRGALEALSDGVAYCTRTLIGHSLAHVLRNALQNNTLPFVPLSASDCFVGGSSNLAVDAPAFTFRKAFVFNTQVRLSQEHEDAYQAVILFNLALLYHRNECAHCETYETTALELYNSSLGLLRRSSHLDCSNLMIVILNNKAQIFFRRNEIEKTRSQLEELGKSLGCALSEGTKALEENDLNQLLLNAACQSALICAPGA